LALGSGNLYSGLTDPFSYPSIFSKSSLTTSGCLLIYQIIINKTKTKTKPKPKPKPKQKEDILKLNRGVL
jgi:hypothetical protein